MPPVVTKLSASFDRAVRLARELHGDQVRKSTEIPYISHLLAVTAIVLENGADEEVAIAAMLHDAIEDGGGAQARERIRHEFGDRVADIVSECSDTDEFPKPPWKERKERYIAHLAFASGDALLVSAADKLHNARAILADLRTHGEGVWERFNAGKDEILWYYRSVHQALERREALPPELLRELITVIDEISRVAGRGPETAGG